MFSLSLGLYLLSLSAERLFMKYLLLGFFCSCHFFLFAQKTTTLAGRINYAGDKSRMLLTLTHPSHLTPIQIPVSAQGTFDVDLSSLIDVPMQVDLHVQVDSLIQRGESVAICIAPSYHLLFEARVDTATFRIDRKQMRMAGEGSEINNIFIQNLAVNYLWSDIELPLAQYVEDLNTSVSKTAQTLDSLAQRQPDLPYIQEWKSLLVTDNTYYGLWQFLGNYAYSNDLTMSEVMQNLPRLGFPDLWTQVNNPNNLHSRSFQLFLSYLNSFVASDFFAYPEAVAQQYADHSLKDIYILNELFSGPVRDVVLHQNISKRIQKTRTLDEALQLQKTVALIENEHYLRDLKSKSDEVVKFASQIEQGKVVSADIIVRNERTGATLKLNDIEGKLIYLETWASWCGPCLVEIPHLKKLKEHYQDNENIIFASIALADDKRDAREKIIADQQMDWLLLEDTKKQFQDFFQINAIPHTVILNGQGIIVDNDGIRPSSPQAIEYLDALLSEAAARELAVDKE